MKKLFVMLAALLAISLPKAAQAFDYQGTYAGFIAGLNFIQYHRDHVEFDFKPGWIVGGYAGVDFCGGFRAEGEISYRFNKTKSIKVRGFDRVHVRGHLETWSFMANGYYDFDLCWCITPYVGGGIGYDITRIKACGSHDSENGFAWQVIAGGLYPIDDCMEIGVEYRFHHGKTKDLYNHTVDARFNFFF